MSKILGKAANKRAGICAFALMLVSTSGMQTAQAQSCTQIPQRVADSGFATAIVPLTSPEVANWSRTGNTLNNWASGYGGAYYWADSIPVTRATADTVSQALTNVSGGAIIQFDFAWNNANNPAGAPAGAPNLGRDGERIVLTMSYAGTDYFEFQSSLLVNTVPQANPGPTSTATRSIVGGAADLSADTSIPAPFLPGGAPPSGNWRTVTLRLPDNVPVNDRISFNTYLPETGTARGGDDVYIRNVRVVDRTLCLVKQTQNASGTFNFTTTNLSVASLSATTPSANGSAAADADSATLGNQPALISANPVAIAESLPTTGHRLTSAVCDNGTTATIGGTATSPVVTLGAINMVLADAGVGRMVTCTLTNSRPRIRLQKALPDGRLATGDQFALTVQGAQNATDTSSTVTTTGATTAPTEVADFIPANPGVSYTLSEAAAGTTALTNYVSSISCSNATTGSATSLPSGSGTSFSLVAAAADDITCTITNSRRLANLMITKTNTGSANGGLDQAADTVTSGNTTTYTITVLNTGRDAANGAIVRDTPGVGLVANSCSVISATPNALATAPASTNWSNLFTTGGLAIPNLASGGQVVFEVQCTVN